MFDVYLRKFHWKKYQKKEMSSIKDYIRNKLNELGISTHKLEKISSLRRGTIQNILSGKSKNPGIYTVQAIAKGLDCPISSLIEENISTDALRSKLNLTAREIECLRCLSQGQTIKETAITLGISYRTVESHLHAIKSKTGYHHKYDLIKLFLTSGDNM